MFDVLTAKPSREFRVVSKVVGDDDRILCTFMNRMID